MRHPKAFLMDERCRTWTRLRVQMRSSYQLQRKLGTTTVTHDQTEAMTLGDRVVVMYGASHNRSAPLRALRTIARQSVCRGLYRLAGHEFLPCQADRDRTDPAVR